MKEKFRLSPTPSGYLHAGNALNFVLNWWQARLRGATLLLRIDDHDEGRKRAEYVADIFEILEWLGLDWDEGPIDPDDFERNYSQTLKKEEYRNFCQTAPGTFWCRCSRKEVGAVYQGKCRDLALKGEGLALRINTDDMKEVSDDLKDCVLWRKDDLPSYQIVSIYEDLQSHVTHVMRGKDLEASSTFQKELAYLMGHNLKTQYLHHDLLKEDGHKLSKSQKASAVRQQFSSSQDFYERVVSHFLMEIYGLKKTIKDARELCSFKYNLFP